MKVTAPFFALFGIVFLGFYLIPGIVAIISESDIDQTFLYRNNSQLVTVEITKPDNTKVDICIPSMSIELEQNACLGNPLLIGTSAQIIKSAVSNFSISHTVCLIFDAQLNPLGSLTTDLRPISKNNTAVEIHAVGCVTPYAYLI